jgi:hypothetical protein
MYHHTQLSFSDRDLLPFIQADLKLLSSISAFHVAEITVVSHLVQTIAILLSG